MEEVWVVYLCLILFIIVVFLMKHNPHVEEAKKEMESKSPPPSSSFFPSSVGKQLEHTQEELEHYLERLTHVFFDTDARKREGHHDQKSHHHQHKSTDAVSEAVEHSGKEAAYSSHLASRTRVQGRTTPPGSTENIVEEIEQAVQETVDTDLYVRRRQHPTASRRYREGHRSELKQISAVIMGDVWLVGLMGLMYIWFPKAAAQNPIKNTKDQKTEHTLLINEINADTPGEDTSEFVELYHTSGQTTRLDGYYLVFYNGNGNQAYRVLNLQGKATNSQGFFLIGSASVNPAIIIPKNTIQNGPDAIAVYYGKGNYKEGMSVTGKGLVDALVHKTKKMDRADTLVRVLTPGRDALLEDSTFRSMDESIERCRGADAQWFFQVAVPTPGTDNHCLLTPQLNASAVLISEVHVASSSEDFEFIELQGPHSTVLRDIILVLIDGQTKDIYFTMDVYGKTSLDGLFLIGPAQSKIPVDLPFPENSTRPVLRDGPSAIALYRGNSSSFAPGKALPAAGLLDAFVYMSTEGLSPELLDTLTPGRPAYRSVRHQLGDVSMSQCNCCSVTRDSLSYIFSRPTPGRFNDCPSRRFSQTVSFCLRVADCQEWLPKSEEILVTLVQALDRSCSCGVFPAYFKDPKAACQDLGLVFTTLLTAKSEAQLSSLLLAFQTFLESPRAVSFDGTNITAESSCFKDVPQPDMTPDAPSEIPEGTPEPSRQSGKLLINEVNPDNPGGREDTEYIELFYTGQTSFDLQGYWLVLYNGKTGRAYRVLELSGHHTDELGFFLVGSSAVHPTPMIRLPANTIQNGADAVALYYSRGMRYVLNMAVTAEGLVDAVVYTSRVPEKAEQLLKVLVPGQGILYENDSHSTEDESLSRCHSLSARLQSSFQVG
ncbi:UNVERIFIED_CONTAM: hypothetical protein H355_001320 [Colinus virginianus]|nr:hypothetical protein H355_001320 [Colinus virginianus]